MMNSQLIQLISIRLKEFVREPAALFWTFLFPLLMAWGLGSAFTSSPDITRTVIVIQNEAGANGKIQNFLDLETKPFPASKYRKAGFEKTYENKVLGSTTFRFIPTDWTGAMEMIKRGVGYIIVTQEKDLLYYHFDPANPEAQLIYMQLKAIFSGNESFFSETAYIKPLDTIGNRYIDFLIPGLIAMSIMSSCMWGVSYTLIEQRSKKLLRRMIATPMKKSYFLLSHLISRLLITTLEVIALMIFAKLYFDIEIQGSITALICLIFAGNIAFIGIATLISSRTANTQVGNGLINFITMPMMILSGIFFSYHNFPDAMQAIVQKLPLTVFADNIRSIFTEGAGFTEIYPGMGVLFIMGIACMLTGLKIFRWY